MALTNFGDNLHTAILCPGSEFNTTKEGFDEGVREYIVDKAYFVAPRDGAPDPENVFPWMYIEKTQILSDRNERIRYRVTLKGVIRRDKDRGEIKKRKRKIVTQPVSFSISSGGGWRDMRAVEITVSDTYVSDIEPDYRKLNLDSKPPGWTQQLPTSKGEAIPGITPIPAKRITGWTLEDIEAEPLGPLFQVVERRVYRTPPRDLGAFTGSA